MPERERDPSTTDRGYYVDLQKTDDGNLNILLTQTGRATFSDIELERNQYGTLAALHALLEDHLANGWELVPPQDIGALTDAPILSDQIERNDEGDVMHAGRVYWYPQYAVEDEIAEIKSVNVGEKVRWVAERKCDTVTRLKQIGRAHV